MEFLKSAIKKIRPYFSRQGRMLMALKRRRRFTPGTCKVFKQDLYYVDGPSFAWQYIEIFQRQLYHFKAANDRPVIIDCGANIGTAVLYFKQFYPDASIIAFEPDPIVFKALQKNTSQLSGVTLVNKGVYNKVGRFSFFSEGADGGQIALSDVHAVKDTIEVQMDRLSTYLVRDIDFLKLDIEGAETMVLEDCRAQLSRVKHIFVEYHSRRNQDQELDQLLSIIRGAGFRYFVESATIHNRRPFIEHELRNGFDNLLNIYGWRK